MDAALQKLLDGAKVPEAEGRCVAPVKPVRKRNPQWDAIGHTDKTPRTNGVNAALPDAFHGDIDCRISLAKEKPAHRLVVYMTVAGKSIKEIADELGMSPAHVSTIIRQPWARTLMQSELKTAGRDELKTLLQGAATGALQTVISMATGEVPVRAETRFKACQDVLDRCMGKATQPVADVTKNLEKLSDDELERIARSGTGSN